jgi:hypothetical protein
MNTESFISASTSSFFQSIGVNIPTLDEFHNFLNDKKDEMIDNGMSAKQANPQYCGGICLQQLILNKLNKLNKNKKKIQNANLKNRLAYFSSDLFINNFIDKLPVRDKLNISIAQSSYKNYFNSLFNVTYEDWRDDKFSKIDNQSQCRRALGIPTGQNIAQLQEIGRIKCYICGRGILPNSSGQSTMECEHVLPILSALSHRWLIKEPSKAYHPDILQSLRLEYDWSHRCCNQLKSNYDFIIYDTAKRGKFRYKANKPIIENLLSEIQTSNKYDCENIKGKISKNQNINIYDRIQPLIDDINYNAEHFDNIDEYILLTKYKVLSALTDDDFLNAIIGDSTIVNVSKPESQIVNEKRELLFRKEQEKIREEAEEKLRKDRIEEQKIARSIRASNRGGINTKKISELSDEDIMNSDIPGYETQYYVSQEEDSFIDEMLTNVRFEPTLEELKEIYNNVFKSTKHASKNSINSIKNSIKNSNYFKKMGEFRRTMKMSNNKDDRNFLLNSKRNNPYNKTKKARNRAMKMNTMHESDSEYEDTMNKYNSMGMVRNIGGYSKTNSKKNKKES